MTHTTATSTSPTVRDSGFIALAFGRMSATLSSREAFASGATAAPDESALPQKRHLIAASWICSAQNGHGFMVTVSERRFSPTSQSFQTGRVCQGAEQTIHTHVVRVKRSRPSSA
jgi:hypothetical protein